MQTSWRPLVPVRRALLVATAFSAGISMLMLVLPLFALQMLEAGIPTGSVRLIAIVAGAAVAVLALAAVVDLCREVVLVRVGLWLDHHLGQEIIETGLALGLPDTTTRTRNQALGQLRDALVGGRLTALTELPWTLLGCAAAALVHPILGLVCFGAVMGMLGFGLLAGSIATRAGVRAEAHAAAVRSWRDSVTAVSPKLSVQGLSSGAKQRFEAFNRGYIANAYTHGIRLGILRAGMRAFHIASAGAVLAAGALLSLDGQVSAGAAVAVLLLAMRGFATIERIASDWHALATARRAWRIIGREHEADFYVRRGMASGVTTPHGHIILEHATAAYPGQSAPAVVGVSLSIEPGAVLGIVGRAGSGKSALAALIAGQIGLASGRAEIDGMPIGKAQRAIRGPAIGYLSDEPLLIAGSIAQNISGFAKLQDPASIRTASTLAGVEEAIAALPAGYETDVGLGGSKLSLRLRRGIALARALHGERKVVVLDEPEAGLDASALSRLEATVTQLRDAGITVILATREPRLLRLTHAVLVMNGGRVEATVPSHRLADLVRPTAHGRSEIGLAIEPRGQVA